MITLIAQTATAITEAAPTPFERIDALVFFLLAILAGYQKWRASKAGTLLDAVIIGVETYKATLPKTEAKRVTGIISAVAVDGGAEPALYKEVKRVTEGARPAFRDDGLPKLGLLLAVSLLLGAGGCVSAAAHNAALAAQESGAILRKASVPDPRYSEADREAYERLWGKHEAALRALAEETK